MCQVHANVHRAPTEVLHLVGVYWPFQVWGLDFVGPINPNSSKGHKYILTAIEYFSNGQKLSLLEPKLVCVLLSLSKSTSYADLVFLKKL